MDDQLYKMADAYLRSLKILNRSALTIKELKRKLHLFFEFLETKGITRADQIRPDVIHEWQTELYQKINFMGRPNSIAYQNKMLSAVKQFFKFLKDKDLIVCNPTCNISYAKEPKTLPKSILSVSEARKILHAPDTSTVFGYRDRTILEMLYSTGIRNMELCNLNIEDVDCDDGFLRIVNGKGGKDRMVPMGRIACRYLENYTQTIRQELIKDPHDPHVFFTSRGNPMNSDTLWRMVRKYGERSGIKKRVHPHTFRHTCATGMLKNKANIRVIQELLGHTFLNTTQIYTHVSISDLKKIHRQCHPRERDRR